MKSGPRVLWAVLAILVLAAPAVGQGSRADYARALALQGSTRNKVERRFERANWLDDGSGIWFRLRSGAFVLVDANTGAETPLFDHDRLAKALGIEGERIPILDLVVRARSLRLMLQGTLEIRDCDRKTYAVTLLAPRDAPEFALPPGRADRSRTTGGESAIILLNPTDVPVEMIWLDFEGRPKSYGTLAPGAHRRQHTFAGHVWTGRSTDGRTFARFVATAKPRVARLDQQSAPAVEQLPPSLSPDGRYHAFIKKHDVGLRDTRSGETWRLTEDGEARLYFGGPVAWAPDSRRFVALRTLAAPARRVPLVESSPRDRVKPRLHHHPYRKPGDRVPQSQPWIFDVEARAGQPVDDALFPNPWSLTHLRWDPDGTRFTFLHNQRGHQVLRLFAVDARTAAASVLIEETSRTFIDYAGKLFLRRLDGTGEILWMSERDGWNHLFLYDGHKGRVKTQVTRGEWVVRRVERVDAKARRVWFWAGGIRPGEDPYHLHLCRVNLDGTDLTILTEGDGTHEVEFSPDRRMFLDTWSRVDRPPVTALRSAADGKLLRVVDRAADAPLRAMGWRRPERFVAKGRDGTTDIHGVIYRPTTFDSTHRYPVVEQIYAGPHGSHVPRAFRPFHGPQALAELGFIVVQIDGMGTSHRSKAFHDVCWKNLADAGFPDRILWLRAAAKAHPEMDLDRVGILGGSAGGQNAMRALLAHGDVYRVGVADCGCHDNRMDKIWWNELWMGWPVEEHYAEQSNVTQAHRLTGKLLLIVGELDRNVDPASTVQVVDALVRADKDFDLLVIPGAGHGAGGTPYGRRRTWDFLVRHLHGVEPRSR